ncbi:MAG: 30S ribosome-binding factor RbfA [Rickettsiales bacterium]
MDNFKINKIASKIKQELYSIIKFGSILHPDLEKYMFSIFEIKLAKDLSFAKCFIMSYDEKNINKVIKLLNNIAPLIKHELAKKIQLRKVPNFLFVDSKYAPENLRYQDEYGL